MSGYVLLGVDGFLGLKCFQHPHTVYKAVKIPLSPLTETTYLFVMGFANVFSCGGILSQVLYLTKRCIVKGLRDYRTSKKDFPVYMF